MLNCLSLVMCAYRWAVKYSTELPQSHPYWHRLHQRRLWPSVPQSGTHHESDLHQQWQWASQPRGMYILNALHIVDLHTASLRKLCLLSPRGWCFVFCYLIRSAKIKMRRYCPSLFLEVLIYIKLKIHDVIQSSLLNKINLLMIIAWSTDSYYPLHIITQLSLHCNNIQLNDVANKTFEVIFFYFRNKF